MGIQNCFPYRIYKIKSIYLKAMINFTGSASFNTQIMRNASFCNLDCLTLQETDHHKQYSQTDRDGKNLGRIVNLDQCSSQDQWDLSIECTFFQSHQKLALAKIQYFASFLNIQLNPTDQQQYQRILEYQFNIDQSKKQPLGKDILKNYKKLKEFLQILKDRIGSAVFADIQLACFSILREYQKLRQFEISEEDLLKIRDKLIGGQLKDSLVQEIPIFSHQNRGETQIQEISEFIKFLTTTVLFIAEEFFINPYSQREELEDDEDQKSIRSYLDYLQSQLDDQSNDQQQENGIQRGLYGRKIRKTE